jgi:hypothetical protein
MIKTIVTSALAAAFALGLATAAIAGEFVICAAGALPTANR